MIDLEESLNKISKYQSMYNICELWTAHMHIDLRCEQIEGYLPKDWTMVTSSSHHIFCIDKIPTAQVSQKEEKKKIGKWGFKVIMQVLHSDLKEVFGKLHNQVSRE
jgi:hypothetical protein